MSTDQTSQLSQPTVLNYPPPLHAGEVLLIVPPFFIATRTCLAVHLLQACARQAGFRVSVLYANLWLAAVLGAENYIKISNATRYPPLALEGERLFARRAHDLPPLGNWSDRIVDPALMLGESPTYRKVYAAEFMTPTLSMPVETLHTLEVRVAAWVDTVAAAVVAQGFQVVGCTSTFAQTNASLALLKAIKRGQPQVTTILGGRNCEGEMAQGMASLDPERKTLDYIFSGESERSFVAFLQAGRAGRLPAERVIEGEPCSELDALPPPDFAEYFEQLRFWEPALELPPEEKVSLLYETSRGCWWGQKHPCTFCGINSHAMAFREKSPERAFSDLRTLAEAYPERAVYMADSAMPRSYFKTLLPELRTAQLPMTVAYAQKANLSLADVLEMRRAGVFLIEPGIESLSTRLLARMNKGLTARQNIHLLRYARIGDLQLTWALLWGIPGDEVQDFEQTLALLPLLRHLPPPGGLLHLSLDRFSPYFEHPERYGIRNLMPPGCYSGIFPPDADFNRLAFHFLGDYECASHEHLDLMGAIAGEIAEWKRGWDPARFSPVMLHVLQSGDRFLLMDARGVPQARPIQVLDREQARAALTDRPYEETPAITWALENKVGVVLDGWYVALATADARLVQAFEAEARSGL